MNEKNLMKQKSIYIILNMEDITNADYMQAKRLCKYFERKKIYMICILKVIHYFYNTLYYYVFKIFRKLCLKIYELDPAKFLSDPGLALQAALKKTEVKLKLLSNINMLLMVEKRIRGGICHAIHRYAKANNKYMKEMIKINNHHILNIEM